MPEIDMESDVHVNFDLDFTRILLGIYITKKKKKLFVKIFIDLINKNVCLGLKILFALGIAIFCIN